MKNTLIILLLTLSIATFAANNKVDKNKEAKAREWIKNQPLEFIENKGQFMRTDGKTADEVLFKTSFGGCDIYITDKGLSYVFVKMEEVEQNKIFKTENKREEEILHKLKFGEKDKDENKSISYYRLDMNLEGANISKSNIIKENESKQGHYNYFYAHCPEGIYNVKGYGKITIKNIYKGIDWVIYTNSDSKEHPLKYDFVVHPGADYKDIKIKFLNAQSTSLLDNDTKLKIETIAGNIEEGNLYSYQSNSHNEISSKYIIDKYSIISFEIANYDTTKTLVIDPLVWATYYSRGIASSVYVDKLDNIYVTGSAFNGFPLLQMNGAFWKPISYNLKEDIFIIKFNSYGIRLWATFYGGTEDENSTSIITDNQNNLYLTGITLSTDFPIQATIGAFIQSNNASSSNFKINGFILKFDKFGVRQWATYYGGDYQDFFNNMGVDSQDNLYIIGTTHSSTFPVYQLNGAYWQVSPSYLGSGFILKFSNQGIRQWATYYSGTNNNTTFSSICIDKQDNIFITGHTTSQNIPLQQMSGAYWQTASVGSNTIILKFDKNGIRQWATCYGNGGNAGSSICLDSEENIYIAGEIYNTNFPLEQISDAYWQPNLSGLSDIYLLKFNKQGVRQWATYYGGSKHDDVFSIKADKDDNIFIIGRTFSNDFPIQQVNGEYWQSIFDGDYSSFILKLNKNCKRQWATLYGGSISSEATEIAFDSQNAAFIIGNCNDTNLYTIDYGNGAYYESIANTTISGNHNIYILKIKPCIQKPLSMVSNLNNICVNEFETINLTSNGGYGDSLKWYSNACGTDYIGINSPITISAPKQTTIYYARWESDCGVSECDSITIFVNDCEIKLELPNIITPNNDGNNDKFLPILTENIEKMNTQIFNRWGNLIYETDNLQIEWDGKYNGTFVADGVYFWIINYRDTQGKESMMKGTVSVLK